MGVREVKSCVDSDKAFRWFWLKDTVGNKNLIINRHVHVGPSQTLQYNLDLLKTPSSPPFVMG